MRDKRRIGRDEERGNQSWVRDTCEQAGVMRLVTVSQWPGHADTRLHCPVSCLSPRSLQMAALQTLQCPLAWRLQTLATSRLGYCSPADTGGPMGARVSRLTGQWEAGRCKGWHPSVQPVLQIQNTDSGEATCSGLQSGRCFRVLSRNWGSITDHRQPLFPAWDRSTVSTFSVATVLGSHSQVKTCVQKNKHSTFLQWH